MNYAELKKEQIRGWHTWNVRSVLSHVHMLDGFALNLAFKEYREGHYLKETLVGRFPDEYRRVPSEVAIPGVHAFDDSYTEMSFTWCDMEIRVESAVEADELVLLVTPLKTQIHPPMLVLESGFLFGRDGYVRKNRNELNGYGSEREYRVFTTGKEMIDRNIPVQTAVLSVCLDGPVAFSTGKARSFQEVCVIIEAKKAAHREKTEEYGSMREMYEAMESALSWDTVYDANNDRVVSPVSRLWSITSGGYVLFCWDNFFAGYMASFGNRALAYSNLREILNEQTVDGFVPNFAYATGQKSADRSQPPVGSRMLLETYKRLGETWIIEEMFDGLLQWNRWFAKHRMNKSGALAWGSERIPVLFGNQWETTGVHDTYGAALESGLDNSPMYDDVPFNKETNRLELEDVGLTGLYIMDCAALIDLAQIIGRTEVLPELKERHDKACAGLEGLWDNEFGFYCNKRTDTGAFSHRISPTNFYALFAPSVSDARKARISAHYYAPQEFYGEWMLPAIARNDPAFNDQEYWRGRVWAPLNFLTWLALKNAGMDEERHDLAEKSYHLFMKEWSEHRHVHENYNAITGEGCDSGNSDKFYHWGALLCVIAMEDGIE